VFRKLAIRFMSYEDRAAMGILSVPERMQSASGIKTVDIAEPKMAPSTNGKIERDLPICGTCGHFMRPNGACYVCEGCGSTSGCS
jgi:ribonucleoside-diphosphate reductase alpha chain